MNFKALIQLAEAAKKRTIVRTPTKLAVSLLQSGDVQKLYKYAKNTLRRRWPEAEPHIMKDPWYAHQYAIDVIKRRWPEAEPHIMKDDATAAYYAALILKKRWPEAEPTIMKNPQTAIYYAHNLLDGKRWPEAEQYIVTDPYFSDMYAREILKHRWRAAEPYIKTLNNVWNKYQNHFAEEFIDDL